MPQKKNPDLLELTRAKAARVIGASSALMITMKGLPLAYNKDLQETQEPLFDASQTVLALFPLVTGWIKTVEFNYQRMLEATSAGLVNAWAAATYLTKRGVPCRLAHELVGKAVQLALEKNCELQDLPLDELRELSPAFDQDFFPCLELEEVLAIHDVIGGTAPARVREAIAETKQKIDSIRGQVHANA